MMATNACCCLKAQILKLVLAMCVRGVDSQRMSQICKMYCACTYAAYALQPSTVFVKPYLSLRAAIESQNWISGLLSFPFFISLFLEFLSSLFLIISSHHFCFSSIFSLFVFLFICQWSMVRIEFSSVLKVWSSEGLWPLLRNVEDQQWSKHPEFMRMKAHEIDV